MAEVKPRPPMEPGRVVCIQVRSSMEAHAMSDKQERTQTSNHDAASWVRVGAMVHSQKLGHDIVATQHLISTSGDETGSGGHQGGALRAGTWPYPGRSVTHGH